MTQANCWGNDSQTRRHTSYHKYIKKDGATSHVGALPARNVSDVAGSAQSQDDCLSFNASRLKHCICPIFLNANLGLEGKLQLFQSCAQLRIAKDRGFVRQRSKPQPVQLPLQARPC